MTQNSAAHCEAANHSTGIHRGCTAQSSVQGAGGLSWSGNRALNHPLCLYIPQAAWRQPWRPLKGPLAAEKTLLPILASSVPGIQSKSFSADLSDSGSEQGLTFGFWHHPADHLASVPKQPENQGEVQPRIAGLCSEKAERAAETARRLLGEESRAGSRNGCGAVSLSGKRRKWRMIYLRLSFTWLALPPRRALVIHSSPTPRAT